MAGATLFDTHWLLLFAVVTSYSLIPLLWTTIGSAASTNTPALGMVFRGPGYRDVICNEHLI